MFYKINLILIIFILVNLILICSSASGTNKPKNYDKYITHIFNKYGSKGVINFEGLEHLMHNLGIGGIDFLPNHKIEEHHPDGYIPPDIILNEDEILTYPENDIDKVDDIIIKHNHDGLDDNNRNDEIILDTKEILNENDKYFSENENDENKIKNDEMFVNNIFRNIELKELHDPLHRHLSSHGKLYKKNCLSPYSLSKLYFGMVPDYKIIFNEDENDENSDEIDYLSHHPNQQNHNNDDMKYNKKKHFSLANVKISPEKFIEMCPILLTQIESGSCKEVLVTKETHFFEDAWIYATIAIIIISLCGLSGVALVPLLKSEAYDEILRLLVAIAIGTLCGDALMHLLPHALISHSDHGHHSTNESSHAINEPVLICGFAFVSAMIMFVIEKFLPLLTGNHQEHGHSHGNHKKEKTDLEMDITQCNQSAENTLKEASVMLDETMIDKKFKLSAVAFMVLIGDGLHNITDGLAIGAAFAYDPITGMATALAVFCHELPHELGDFALLISTGVSIKRAMYYNIISSILSFLGMCIGILIAQMHTSVVRWIYSATAGSFLYIAFVDLIPELNRTAKTGKQLSIMLIGMILGGIIMLLIGLYEDHLRMLFE